MKHWIQARWLEVRLGYSTYIAYALAFFNLIILISLRFNQTASQSISTAIIILFGLSIIAVLIGHAHLKWQQSTDIRLEFEWMVEETANRVIRKMKEASEQR